MVCPVCTLWGPFNQTCTVMLFPYTRTSLTEKACKDYGRVDRGQYVPLVLIMRFVNCENVTVEFL